MSDQHEHGAMGSRGVTRPMAEMQMQHGQHGGDHQKGSDDKGGHEMGHDDRISMLKMHHKQTLWIYWTLPLLGIWLILSPFHFGYLNERLWVDPSGGRGPWFEEQSTPQLQELRAWLMTASDVLSGLVSLPA